MNNDTKFWISLVRFPKFGPVRIKKLAAAFHSMEAAFSSSRDELIAAGIEPKIADQFIFERASIHPDEEAAKLVTHNVTAVTFQDDAYPPDLKTIFDPPPVLFVRGVLPNPKRVHLAVVGTRKPTQYGLQVTKEFVGPIAKSGVVIVSGLAYGIDAAAHEATLEVGGTTVAILGGGLDDDNVYPSQHRALANRIVAGGGAVISEFPVGTHPMPQNFPFRNRIIAGMTRGTLVTEALIKSGSLITARGAIEIGRDVFAVPGSIHAPMSEGPNNLIKTGSFPVTTPEDVLSRLGMVVRETKPDYVPGSAEERTVYDALTREPLHVDEITVATGMEPRTVTSTLTLMELKGSARHLGGLYYVRG